MNRKTTVAVLLVAMVALSGAFVGAVQISDSLFEEQDTEEAGDILLDAVDAAEDAGYVFDDEGDIGLSIDELTSGGEATVDEVFTATYEGDTSGTVDFATDADGVDILDSDGNVVEEPVEFEDDGQTETFGVHIEESTAAADSLSEVTISATVEEEEVEDPPTNPISFDGTVNDSADVDAPAGTTIVAVNDRSGETSTATVEDDGTYGTSGTEGDDISLEAAEDDDIFFYVREEDGPAYIDNPYTVQEEDVDDDTTTIIEEDLTFDAGTFDLQVEDLAANATEVEQGETVNVNATLVNNGSLDLEQNVDLTINGDPVEGLTQEPNVTAGTSEEVEFDYTFEDEEPDTYDVNIITEDDDDDDRALEITVTDAMLNIVNVDNAAFNLDFVGIVEDDDDLGVTADSIEDDEGEVDDEQVTLSLAVGEEDPVILAENIDVTDGSIDAAVDPTNVPNDVEVGQDADLVIEEFETDASVTLIHEVNNVSAGATPTSAPLAAQVYHEGSFSVTQWDDESQSYSSDAITGDDFTDATNVHRGLFILTNDPDVRFGYEFQEASFEDDAEVTLNEGWNLVSSNYNISAEDTPDVEEDLNLQDTDYVEDISVVDATDRDNFPAADDESGPYNVYWVLTEDGEVTRNLDNSTYSP